MSYPTIGDLADLVQRMGGVQTRERHLDQITLFQQADGRQLPRQELLQELAGVAFLHLGDRLRRPGGDQLPAAGPALRA
jgi:hypothetical protein